MSREETETEEKETTYWSHTLLKRADRCSVCFDLFACLLVCLSISLSWLCRIGTAAPFSGLLCFVLFLV